MAFIFPPAAVLMCDKPFEALIAFFLMLFFWIPGTLYACFVIASSEANERNEKLIRAIQGTSAPAKPFNPDTDWDKTKIYGEKPSPTAADRLSQLDRPIFRD